MRRSALATLAASILVLLPASPAFADPSPSAAAATPGKSVCSVTDSKLSNITGIAATSSGYVVARTGSQNVYKLDSHCKIATTLTYPPHALSPQDVTVGHDGSIWVADTGTTGDGENRTRVALWKFPASGGKATIYRVKYPGGGAQLDSHAMVMTGSGVPVFITKVNSGPAGLYTPAAALDPKGTEVPLKKVGEFTPQHTGTNNPLGALGNSIVTGGATSSDGTKVVLRTYSDAYEWSVTNGDVVAAITGSTKPLVTPLVNETTGEGITFSADGKSFVTVSGAADEKASILRYTPSVATKTSTASSGGDSGDSASGSSTWWDKLSLEQIVYLVGAIGVIGLLMVVGGVVGIRNSRKQKRREALAAARQAGPGRASVPVPPQGYRRYDQYGEQQYGEPYGEQPYGAEQQQYGAEQQQYGSGRTYGGGQQYGSGRQHGGEQQYDSGQQYDPYENQYGGGTYGSEHAPQQNRGGYGGGYDPPAPRHPREEEQYQDGYGAPYGQQPSQSGTYGTPRPAPPRPPAGRGYADDQDGYGDWR